MNVGGRILESPLAVSNLTQVITNEKKRSLSKFIVSDHHQFNIQIGREHTLAAIRKHYCIPSSRGFNQMVLNECFYCKKMFAKPQNPLMSDLSKERFHINEKSYSTTGIDYFGPTHVKTSKRT